MRRFFPFLLVSTSFAFVVPGPLDSVSMQLSALRFTGFQQRSAAENNAEANTAPLPDFTSPHFGYPDTVRAADNTPTRGPGFFGRGAMKAQALLTETKTKWMQLREKLSFNRNNNEASEIQKMMAGLEKQGEACQVLEMLMQAKEKTLQLKEVLQQKAAANELEIAELRVELEKQETECKALEAKLVAITNDYENFKSMASQEQAALQQQFDSRYSEMSNVLLEARELCGLLDELIEL